MDITQEELKELLRYDGKTGKFYHIRIRKGVSDLSKEAGCVDDGYVKIGLNGRRYRAHRLVWLYVYGEFPSDEIDHINHNRSDNRISNLRIVSHSDNCKNASMYDTNTSGVNGVHWDKNRNKWQVIISVNNKNKYVGRYESLVDACDARMNAEIECGYHINHGENE